MDADAKQIPYQGDKPCSSCGNDKVASVIWASGRKGSRPLIPSWCLAQQHFFDHLPIAKYGHHFGMSTTRLPTQPADYRIKQRRRFEILERDGFACVYCREPASTTQIDEVREIVETSVSSMTNDDGTPGFYTLEETKTFFGHDVDHLFTLADLTLLDGHIEASSKHKIRQRWVVTGCPDCNNGRKGRATTYGTLLSVYARHLFEINGEPDLEDLKEFINVLTLLRYCRKIAAQKTG